MKFSSFRQYFVEPTKIWDQVKFKVYIYRNPDHPWMTPESIKFCDQNLKPSMVGFEWGSGRSTLWFAKRLGTLFSIEHDQTWHARIQQMIKETEAKNVKCELILLDHDVNEPMAKDIVPLPAYVRAIEKFDRDSLDFVVVDGHYRQACLSAALPRIKKGGYLLLDNSNWMPLDEWGIPQEWEIIH